MSNPFISDDYYDDDTCHLLLNTLNEEDREYLKDKNITELMLKRWRTIICGLPNNYYNQYCSNSTQQDRNGWFKKYLDYPTKDISQMPDVL